MNQMIRLIGKNFLRNRVLALQSNHCRAFSTSPPEPISVTSITSDQQAFTVSYLLNSCGLSLESAILASMKLRIKTTDTPDAVLKMLRTNGFNQTLIRNLIISRPALLQVDPDETLKPNIDLFASLGFSGPSLAQIMTKAPRLLETKAHTMVEFLRAQGLSENQISLLTMKRPKLYGCDIYKNFFPKFEYFKSLGFSKLEIAHLLLAAPSILEKSLECQIMPSVQFIKRIVCSDENVLKVIRRCSRVLTNKEVMEANISILISCGVPESKIPSLMILVPRSLVLYTDRFNEIIRDVVRLGFDPATLLLRLAVHPREFPNHSRWEQKLEAYGSFGLSKDEIISAYKLRPSCLDRSEKQIRRIMGFFVNGMNLKPSVILRNPDLMKFSLERRIIPRFSVLQLLISKNLVKSDISIIYALTISEDKFVHRFVNKYLDVVPEVVQAHKGEIGFNEFLFKLMDCQKCPVQCQTVLALESISYNSTSI